MSSHADRYSLLGSRALLRIRVDQDIRRSGCQHWNQTCPLGIRVMQDYSLAGRSRIDDPDCARCSDCADVCPREILSMCAKEGQPSQPWRGLGLAEGRWPGE